jgi:DNA-binding MarR family transcriptional regulator
MKEKLGTKDNVRQEAARLNTMINILTVFTRRTTLEWLPQIASIAGVTREQLSIMYELNIQPDQCLKNLSHNLMASPSNVSVMIQSMVEGGVVCRITDPKDRRRVLLRLSEDGEKLYATAEEDLVKRYHEYLINLSDADRKDLDYASQLMVQVMGRILKRT